MIYKWRAGTRARVSAQVAGEICEQMSANGELTPKALVEASRPEDAPLHKAFEWDDAKAAEAYRETQAAYIIRHIEVERKDIAEPVRAFLTIPPTEEDAPHCYQSTEVILRDKDSREALLELAKRELAAFARKYQQLAELAGVIAEAEKLLTAA